MKKILKIVGRILSILSIVFLVYAVVKLGYSLDFTIIVNWKLFIVIVIGGILIKILTVFIQGNGWAEWLMFFSDTDFEKKDAVKVYVKANIGKYIPGNVMHYVERNLFAKNLGVTQKNAALCSVLEVAGLIIVALVTTLSLSYTQILKIVNYIFGDKDKCVIIIAVVLLIVFVAAISVILLKKFGKNFPKGKFFRALGINLIQYFIVLVCLGLILVGLCLCVDYSLNIRNITLILSSYIASWVLGFIIPGSPGGMGVRELVLTVLAGGIIGKDFILSLTIIHRGITIVGDFIAYLIIMIIRKKQNNGADKDERC